MESLVGAAEERQALVRIKRRRDEAAANTIILEAASSGKRARGTDLLLLQFQGMAVGQAAQAPQPPAKRRFVRVQTLNAAAFLGKSDQELYQLVQGLRAQRTPAAAHGASSHRPATAPRQAVTTPPSADAAAHRAARRAAHQQASQAARYKQIRRRREGTAAASALEMYDLEATPGAATAATAQPAHPRPEMPQQQQPQQCRQPQARAPEPAVPSHEEELLRSVYGPMLEAYLSEVGATPSGAAAAAAAAAKQERTASASSASSAAEPLVPEAAAAPTARLDGAGTAPVDAAAPGPPREAGEEDEYVYDVYLPMPGEGADGGEALGADLGHAPHMNGDNDDNDDDPFIPVIQVAENDDEFFWALEEQHDEDHDSEDSNAESYYANSYPDEEAPNGGGTDDDDSSLDSGQINAYPGRERAGHMAGRCAEGSSSEGSQGEGSEEEGGRARRGGARGGGAAPPPRGRYRTESDDYSAHSSDMSDDEAARDARDRRARGLFLH